MNKRLLISLIMGVLLGVFCIIGAQARFGNTLDSVYLFSFWFNRFLLGLVIGLIPHEKILSKALLRGAVLGIIISFAFYSSTDFLDHTGFVVGAIYGIIIELILNKTIK